MRESWGHSSMSELDHDRFAVSDSIGACRGQFGKRTCNCGRSDDVDSDSLQILFLHSSRQRFACGKTRRLPAMP